MGKLYLNRKLSGENYIENDYIFKHADGSLYHPDYPTKAFKKCIRKIPELPQSITFHGLRKSCVSILVKMGLDLKAIQEWVGHRDIKTTLAIYYKIKEREAKLEVSEKLNEKIRNYRERRKMMLEN